MNRFHAPCALPVGQTLFLPEATVRHMQVLRLQPGDEVDLFTGLGGVHRVRIASMGRQRIEVDVLDHRDEEREATVSVQLAVCMPANDRMDWLVEKATELGVQRITPLMSSRSVLRLDGQRAERRMAHWLGIAGHACAQCGRNRLPQVDVPTDLSSWLTAWIKNGEGRGASHGLAPAPASAPWLGLLSLSDRSQAVMQRPWRDAQHLCWLIGPEGGFTPEEETLALAAGATPMSLGPRVLRAETAALTALAFATA